MAPETKEDAFMIAFSKKMPNFSTKCHIFGCSNPNSELECADCGRPLTEELDGIIPTMLTYIIIKAKKMLGKIYANRKTLMF